MSGRLRLCSSPGCRVIVTSGRCDKHRAKERSREPSPPTRWDSESKQFLDSPAWQRLRAAYLAENPYCQSCLENGCYVAAVEVDHVLPRYDHPELALNGAT